MNAPFLYVMYKQACCSLLNIPKQRVRQWLSNFETIILDADGVIWRLGKPLKGSVDTVNALKAMGKKVFICTNNSTISRHIMAQRANEMGILITADEFITSSYAAAHFLKRKDFKQKVYLVGKMGIADELRAVGIKHTPAGEDSMITSMAKYAETLKLEENIGAVVVGQDEYFSVPKLIKASSYLQDPNCLFVATNRDPGFPTGTGIILPGAGSMVAAIKSSSSRKPITVGKPNPFMCAEHFKCGIIKAETTLMIGDTLHTDILFGYNCGFQTMFVESGVSTLKQIKKIQESDDPKKYKLVPDVYIPKLADLMNFLPFKNPN